MPTLVVEYAKSGRSKCSLAGCGKKIDKHEVRIGTIIVLPYGDEGAESVKWRHLCCFTDRQIKNGEQSGDLDHIRGFEDLAPADKELIEKMKRGDLIGKTTIIGRVGEILNSAMAHEVKTRKPAPKKTPKKQEQAAASPAMEAERDDVDSQVTEEYEVDVVDVKEKPLCPYGKNCFRTNPDHFTAFSHQEDAGVTSSSSKKPTIVSKRHRS